MQIQDQINEVLQVLKEVAEKGSALDVYLLADWAEKQFKKIKNDVKDDAIDEAESYGEKTFQKRGFEIQVKGTPGKWDFSASDEFLKLEKELNDIKELMKLRYKSWEKGKSMGQGDDNVDTATGEIVPAGPMATYKGGSTTLSIKLLKKVD